MTDADADAAFATLADALIPAAEGMPVASAAADLKTGLASVLNSRPDLRGDVMRGLRMLHEGTPVAALQAADPEAWAALTLAAASIYYGSAPVQDLLGYRGPERRAYDADATPEYVENGMLAEVIARGRMWRAA